MLQKLEFLIIIQLIDYLLEDLNGAKALRKVANSISNQLLIGITGDLVLSLGLKWRS